MIKIIEKIVEGIAVCTIEGKLSGIEGKGTVQDKVRELMDRDINVIVLDLSRVNWIDSTGLGELIASLSTLKKNNGNMVLSNIQSPVQSLLKMTNLTQIFDTYPDVAEAVATLSEQTS